MLLIEKYSRHPHAIHSLLNININTVNPFPRRERFDPFQQSLSLSLSSIKAETIPSEEREREEKKKLEGEGGGESY